MRASNEGSSSSTLHVTSAPSSSRPELGTTRHMHDYAVRPRVTCEYPTILNQIGSAINLVYEAEKSLVNCGVISPSQTNIIELEKHLLDLSSISHATQGIFYVLTVGSGTSQLVRFFEGGSFLGFYHQKKGGPSFPEFLNGHVYRVYTEQDVTQRNCRKSKMLRNRPHKGKGNKVSKQRSRPGQAYSRALCHIKNHIEVLKYIARDAENETPLRLFVNIVRKNADLDNPDHRYVHTIGFTPHQQACLERDLLDFRLQGCYQYPTLETLSSAPLPLSMQSQLDVLCSISNDPFQVYPTTDGSISVASSRVGYMRYLSYQHPHNGEDSAPSMLPSSFRNRFIYFHRNGRDAECRKLLQHIFSDRDASCHRSEVYTCSTSDRLQSEQQMEDDAPPPAQPHSPPSKNKTRPVVKITAEILRRKRGPCAPSLSLIEMKAYQNFCTKLVEVGRILWRLHTVDVEYFIMNEYVDGGELVPNSFVEVRYQKNDGHATCTCSTYKIICGIASTEKAREDVLPAGILCMHCRFFTEEILPRLQLLDAVETDDELPSLLQKLRESRIFLNNPVVSLTSGPGTQKYSVRPQTGTTCAIVHVSSTGVMANCTKGTCQAAQRHKRSVNGLLKLENASSLCEHLATMHANQEVWAPKQALGETVESEGDTSDVDTEDLAMPLEESMIPSQQYFNPDTEKWNFGGYSTHKPLDEHDIQKSRNIQRRMAIYDGNPDYPRDRQTGCFSGMNLMPKLPGNNLCDCGSPFKNEQHPNGLPPVEDFACILYMRHAPVQCKVYSLRCLNAGGNCKHLVKYSGQEDSVFLWSKHVGAGDEIGWDFINRVISSKMSFSAFCNDMTRIYKSINVLSAPFMHKSTFVSWFFAWCSRMDIDFRTEVDPWCGYSPKYVAGDGTHIGISFRRLSISPVEKADAGCMKTPRHRRFDRVFLHYRKGIDDSCVRKARKHLKDTAKAYLTKATLDLTAKEANDHNLLEVCSQDHRCKEFIRLFLAGDMDAGLKQATAEFVLLLASDAAVTTVLPPRYHDDVRASATLMVQDEHSSMDKFSMFCPEIACMMEKASNNHLYKHCFANFLLYLLDFVNSIHQQDEEHTPAVEIPSSYNPESGVAYYFTRHGNVVRQLPAYQVNSTGNHDDQPCLEERCTKKFGKVSFGGWTYLFLWFCPLHGHCYGYHMVQGAEGRKDPFASLIRYMEDPPKELFYDFACSLSEYCLNREPAFFGDTRMWHDVFHSVTHMCGKNFKSRRLQFEFFNTEICEQFNSFIQCIKYTGTHLSQSHFTFFIQFMIYVWNKRKTSTFTKKMDLALAGYD